MSTTRKPRSPVESFFSPRWGEKACRRAVAKMSGLTKARELWVGGRESFSWIFMGSLGEMSVKQFSELDRRGRVYGRASRRMDSPPWPCSRVRI